MKTIKIIKLSDKERSDIETSYNNQDDPQVSLEDILAANENQTLAVLRNIKAMTKWDDIEKAVDFVALIKKFEACKDDSIDLDKDELKLVLDTFKSAVKTSGLQGVGLEKFTEVYSTFN